MDNGIVVGMGIIKKWEKCRLHAFRPIPGDPWTIGWGATGEGINANTVWTQEEADVMLEDACETRAKLLRSVLKVPITDNQFGALLSLSYNENVYAILKSTLIRKLNAGDTQGAADEFLRWDFAHGREIQGLKNRREDERNVFLT